MRFEIKAPPPKRLHDGSNLEKCASRVNNFHLIIENIRSEGSNVVTCLPWTPRYFFPQKWNARDFKTSSPVTFKIQAYIWLLYWLSTHTWLASRPPCHSTPTLTFPKHLSFFSFFITKRETTFLHSKWHFKVRLLMNPAQDEMGLCHWVCTQLNACYVSSAFLFLTVLWLHFQRWVLASNHVNWLSGDPHGSIRSTHLFGLVWIWDRLTGHRDWICIFPRQKTMCTVASLYPKPAFMRITLDFRQIQATLARLLRSLHYIS